MTADLNEVPLDAIGRQPAIFVHSDFYVGRTRIGTSVTELRWISHLLLATVFSWLYLFPFLRAASSEWEFLPIGRTEFVRVRLRQAIQWHRVRVLFFVWLLLLLGIGAVGVLVGTMLGWIRPGLALLQQPPSVFLIPAAIAYVVDNLMVTLWMAFKGEGLTRSKVTLGYGFPKKYDLLTGFSDAPISQQLDGVLQLCRSLAQIDFGRAHHVIHQEDFRGR